jgi:hypothetical protein
VPVPYERFSMNRLGGPGRGRVEAEAFGLAREIRVGPGGLEKFRIVDFRRLVLEADFKCVFSDSDFGGQFQVCDFR